MRIAAYDYGKSNGIAIAEVCAENILEPVRIELRKYLLVTAVNNAEKYGTIARCKIIVLEDRPANSPIKEFDKLWYHFLDSGYLIGQENKKLVLIQPSQWKPLAKAMQPDLSAWQPETKHEKDAMHLLWYYLHIIRLKGKVKVEYV